MKFTHSIKFNAVPEWEANYLKYGTLKKLIYAMEPVSGVPSVEQSPTDEGCHDFGIEAPERPVQGKARGAAAVDDDTFLKMLDYELERISTFYAKKEKELLARLEALSSTAQEIEASSQPAPGTLLIPLLQDILSTSDVEGEEQKPGARNPAVWKQSTMRVRLAREKLRASGIELYVQLKGLQEYIDLNRTGFRKVLKKHDKVTHRQLKDTYMPRVEQVLAGYGSDKLQNALERLVALYAVVSCKGNKELASLELKRHLRDRIIFERNTVWKEMVESERRTVAAKVEPSQLTFRQRWGQVLALLVALSALGALLCIPIFPEPEKQNCLALLVFVSLLWCTEALPLFVTSMLVPLLVVLLRVLTDTSQTPPHRMTPLEAAGHIFHAMFSEVIMLLLGGFAIAAALSKHFIAKELATWILSQVGTKPAAVLLASMFTATFSAMWISNVASPVLCYSVLRPVLRTLPSGHSFAKALVMGIALASNLGGMASPISSPQNIFAIERMSLDGNPPSWLAWLSVSLPLCTVGNLLCWGFLLYVYQPQKDIANVRPLRPNQDPLSRTQVFVIATSVLTVGLWCANTALQQVTGQMGVIAILPLVAFFGTGILDKDDFNNFLWNVVMLAMGGLALGEAVTSSGLLLSLAQGIQDLVTGCTVWQVLAIFCALVLLTTTFISHTVGAMVILPIVQSVGASMPDPHPKLLVMGAALTCSAAMGLPVSGFPNMNAIALEDPTGQNYLQTWDFIIAGVPSSVLTYGTVITLGYFMMFYVNGW